eukprot:716202-Prorocentrum_minimum.AAC.3
MVKNVRSKCKWLFDVCRGFYCLLEGIEERFDATFHQMVFQLSLHLFNCHFTCQCYLGHVAVARFPFAQLTLHYAIAYAHAAILTHPRQFRTVYLQPADTVGQPVQRSKLKFPLALSALATDWYVACNPVEQALWGVLMRESTVKRSRFNSDRP